MGESLSNLRPTMWSRVAVVILSAASCHAGLLGAGNGEGSCAAAPFRALAVKWPLGCPASAPCCSEYGYCQPEASWHAGAFRDCNGVSNGRPLAPEALAAENEAIAHGDASAANLLVVPAGGSVAGPVAVAPAPVAPVAPVAVAAGNPYAAAAAPVATYAPGINHYATPYAGYAGAVYAGNGYAAAAANGAYAGYAAAPAAAYAAAPAAAYATHAAAYATHAVPAATYAAAGQYY